MLPDYARGIITVMLISFERVFSGNGFGGFGLNWLPASTRYLGSSVPAYLKASFIFLF